MSGITPKVASNVEDMAVMIPVKYRAVPGHVRTSSVDAPGVAEDGDSCSRICTYDVPVMGGSTVTRTVKRDGVVPVGSVTATERPEHVTLPLLTQSSRNTELAVVPTAHSASNSVVAVARTCDDAIVCPRS